MFSNQNVFAFGDYEVTVIVTAPPYYENCYLVRNTVAGEKLLVDPGSDAEMVMARTLAAEGTLTEILLTHGHPDHIGAVRHIQDAASVPCRAHQDEDVIIKGAKGFASAMGHRGFRPIADCEYFTDEPRIPFSGSDVRVVHTPGHTPGGVCYVFDGFAFTGDTLFNQGVGRTDFPGGDQGKLKESITRFLGEVPGGTVLFSGHGPHWTAEEASRWWRMIAF